MKYTISYITILFLFCLCANAQEKDFNTQKREAKKEKKEKKKKLPEERTNYRPTELRIGTDILSLGNSVFEKNLRRIELNADIDFHHFLLNADLGFENDLFDSTRNKSNGIYSTTGQYFKIGVDRSFTINNPTNSDIFFGFRYARASYKDELTYQRTDDVWGAALLKETNNASARWIELTFGMKVSMSKYIALGYMWRLKLAPKTKGNDAFQPYKIPGYGTTVSRNNVALNFYVLFRLPVPKKKKEKSDLEKIDELLDELTEDQ